MVHYADLGQAPATPSQATSRYRSAVLPSTVFPRFREVLELSELPCKAPGHLLRIGSHKKSDMCEMASALGSMSLDSWEPLVDAAASEKSCRGAHNAARSSPDTDSGGPTPGQDGHNVDT
jgi:hypothetical protein